MGELATINRGVRVTRDMLSEKGIPVYQNALTPLGYYSKSNRKGYKTFVISAGAAGKIGFSDCDFWAADDCYTFDDLHDVSDKFIYYCLQSKQTYIDSQVRRGSIPRISRDVFANIKIPVPPIALQERIVKTLDNFDKICSDLSIGLPAEISLRKKQYEYYRDRILSFNTNVNNSIHGGNLHDEIKLLQYVFGYAMVGLGDIATIMRGGSFQKKDFSESGVPCIHYGQIYTKYGLHADKTFTFISENAAEKQKFAEPNDVVMAVTSENVEDVCKCVAWVGKGKIAVSGHSAIIHHNQNGKYLSYYFHTSMFFEQKRKLAHGTKVIEVTPDTLTKVQIPIPSLSEQERIVAILDKFDALVNDLSQGIPAEIEARKKQYEYYRDKLLSFKEKS